MNKFAILALAVCVLVAVNAQQGPNPPPPTPPTASPTAGSTNLCNTPTLPTINALLTQNTAINAQLQWINGEQCSACTSAGCTCAATDLATCTGCVNQRDVFFPADATNNVKAFCWQPYVKLDNSAVGKPADSDATGCAVNCVDKTLRANVCSQCKIGFYLSAGKCTACPTGCGVCSMASGATAATCTACTGTNYLDSKGACQACPTTLTNCAACKDATTCTACATGYYLVNGACVTCASPATACSAANTPTKCADGNFLDTSKTPAVCTACGSKCRTCTSATACTVCNGDAALNPQNDWVGLYLKSGVCTACADTNTSGKVVYCDGTGNPLVCAPGYIAVATPAANAGCYAAIQYCTKHAWDSTNNKLWCATCGLNGAGAQTYPSQTSCVAAGTGCTMTAGKDSVTAATCTACADTTKYSYDSTNKVCYAIQTQCDKNDTTAYNSLTLKCTTCKTGYSIDTNGICQATNPNCKAGSSDTAMVGTKYLKCKASGCNSGYDVDGLGDCVSTTPYVTGANPGYKATAGSAGFVCVTADANAATCKSGAGGTAANNGCVDANSYVDGAAASLAAATCYTPASKTTTCSPTQVAANCATCNNDPLASTPGTWACATCASGYKLNGSNACVTCTKALNGNAACTACPTNDGNTYYVDTTSGDCTKDSSSVSATCLSATPANWDITKGCTKCGTGKILSTTKVPNSCISCSDSTLTATNGDQCAACDATNGCTACNVGLATLVAKKCTADTNCKVYALDGKTCAACVNGYYADATNKCVACDATKGCTLTAGQNCDLTPPPPPSSGSGSGSASGSASSNSTILSFALYALLIILALIQ